MRALRLSRVVAAVVVVGGVVVLTRPGDCGWGTFSYSIPGPGGTENTDLAVRVGGREVAVTGDGLAAHSSLSPEARRVAFESGRGGRNSDTVGYSKLAVHVAGVDGSNREELTTGPFDEKPDWSPDGASVLFLRERGVWTVDVATKDAQLVYQPVAKDSSVADAAWSGDSSRIAFFVRTGDRDDGAELWVVDADGSHPRRLATLEGRVDELAWSPNGQAFAWTRFEGEAGDLFLTPAAFPAPRMVARDARTPIWSGDGERLAYVTGREGRTPFGLVVAAADASGPERVPESPEHVHDWVACSG